MASEEDQSPWGDCVEDYDQINLCHITGNH